MDTLQAPRHGAQSFTDIPISGSARVHIGNAYYASDAHAAIKGKFIGSAQWVIPD